MSNQPQGFYIPPNYKTGITIAGVTFKTPLFIQAIIFALIPWLVLFLIASNIKAQINWQYAVSITLTICILFGYLGLKGINGYTLTQFLRSYRRYRSKKRICYYNPRIKEEAVPVSPDKETAKMLPREKLEKMLEKMQKEYDKRNREAAVNEQGAYQEDRTNMYFQDDIGVVDKPVEYMTPKEYKKYLKNEKKKKRAELKQQRKEQKGKEEVKKDAVIKKEKESRRKAKQ